MATTPPTTRSTAAERREHLLEAAMSEFASRGYVGGSTERIAKAAGISQPYVFRLYGSKEQLFLAAIERCFDETMTMFQEAAGDLRGEDALQAIGNAYSETIVANPQRLQLQLAGYAACGNGEIREAMRVGYGRLVRFAEQVSGADEERISRFFAKGMLLNVVTAMRLPIDPTDWGTRLIDGCTRQPDSCG